MIDVDTPSTNFVDNTATPKVASLWRAVDEVVAAPVARPTLASDLLTPTGTSTEEVVPPGPVKQKLSNPSLIPLNTSSAFQPSTIHVSRGDGTAAATKRAEQRAVRASSLRRNVETIPD